MCKQSPKWDCLPSKIPVKRACSLSFHTDETSHAGSVRPIKTDSQVKNTLKQSENMGGVIRLWAIPPSDISLTGNFPSFISTDRVVQLDVTQDTAGAEIAPQSSFAGTTYKHEVTGFIPGFDAATKSIIGDLIRQKRFVVIYQDSNSGFVMLGRPEIPIKFSADFSTGSASASPRGYKIIFTGNCHEPPILLSGDPFA